MSRHWGVVPSIAHTKIILHTYVIALRKVVWYHKNSFKSVLVMAWGYICIDKSSYRIVMDWWKFLVSKASKLNSGCIVCFNYTTYYLNSACRWHGTTKTTFQGGRTILLGFNTPESVSNPGPAFLGCRETDVVCLFVLGLGLNVGPGSHSLPFARRS